MLDTYKQRKGQTFTIVIKKLKIQKVDEVNKYSGHQIIEKQNRIQETH